MSPPRILFVGESPRDSAPTLSAARALRTRVGYETLFPDTATLGDTRRWSRLVRTCDAVVVVLYGIPDRWFRRYIALSIVMGRPVIRWWVGTDVFNVLQDQRIRKAALHFDRLVTSNITVATHLRDELASVGVVATFIPSLLDADSIKVSSISPTPKSLLVYLPASRKDFYGFDIVREVVDQNRDIEFIVVADDTHSLASYSNVRSLGWVDDMSGVWDRAGGLLRVTTHDGMPRMVLDALRRAKHVIYAWPFPGCRLARTAGEVQAAVTEFKNSEGDNRLGAEAVRALLDPDPAVRFALEIESTLVSTRWSSWFRAARTVVADTIHLKMRPDS